MPALNNPLPGHRAAGGGYVGLLRKLLDHGARELTRLWKARQQQLVRSISPTTTRSLLSCSLCRAPLALLLSYPHPTADYVCGSLAQWTRSP